MKSIKAFIIIALWTALIGYGLYSVEAHQHYRQIEWALGLSVILLLTHMSNMILYFKLTDKEPYQWFKNKK